ncbi:MAG: hypothetical protein JKX92_06145 [Porticoccaceae bacterium]|nr:hypothetical protein [Porticoccaceae bacterium]
MPVSAIKGHSQRVLEYRAGGGIVCFAWDYGAEDGWWWPLENGVAARTARDGDTEATPYVLLKNSAQKPTLVLKRPQKIGKPGNATPAGQEYWIHESDTRLCVSWNPSTGVVYMRGVPVLDGLDRVVAATIYGGSLVVMSLGNLLSCALNQLRFDGTTAANNAAMNSVSSYSDDDYDTFTAGKKYGYYVSPKGSKIVVLSSTKIRTVSINSEGNASLKTSDQPEPPDVSDLARWTQDDTYTDVVTQGEHSGGGFYDIHTFTGGFSGAVSAGFTYSYQYGVKWSGETPNPVTMTLSRQIDSSYAQEVNHYKASAGDEDETAHYEEYIEYSEEDSSIVSGLGADIEVYYKSASHRRDYVHDYIEVGNNNDENTTEMSLTIAASDVTRRKEDIIRTEKGDVMATLVHTNDESADNQVLSKTLERETASLDTYRYHPFSGVGFTDIDSTFYLQGDMTYSGALSRNLSVALDGNTVLDHDTSHRLNAITKVQGIKLYCNGLYWAKTSFGADAYHPDYPVYYTGDLFEHGFLRDSKWGAVSSYVGRYARRLGKTLVHVLTEYQLDETLAEGRFFASGIGEASGFLDVPTTAQVQNMSVI